MSQTIVITGASSGIGLETANLFAERGWRVYSLSRSKSTKWKPSVIHIPCDINNDNSVQESIFELMKQEKNIDVLVNNSGFTIGGAVEETSIDEVKAIFETNFFGLVRVTNAVLPYMRKSKSGKIVHISSIVGKIPTPFMAFYSATKHAIEGYSESLDHEIRAFGIRSILVEPGFVQTNINNHALRTKKQLEAYSKYRDQFLEIVQTSVDNGSSPHDVASIILAITKASNPKLRYPVGSDSKLLSKLRRFMPTSFFDKSLRKQFKLDM